MDLWVREARLFKYGSGTGTNFSSLRGAGERLSGGGKSSGLMGFLKIGDRAAGAIKSGGTTRRAAKMVIVDADHPDIEDFINWKVIEEQKVASIVAGSKMHERKLNKLFAAIKAWDGIQADAYDPAKNEQLKAAIRTPRKVAIPETYVKRVLDYAKQGHTSIEFPTYDTDWDSEAYSSVSGQNSNNSIRVTNAFLQAVEKDADWELLDRTTGRCPKPSVPAICGNRSATPHGPVPIRASSTTTPSTNGTHAPKTARSVGQTLVPNTCSLTTRPVTLRR